MLTKIIDTNQAPNTTKCKKEERDMIKPTMTEMVPIQEVKEKEHMNGKNQEKMEELKEPMRDGKLEYQEEDIEMWDSLLLGKKQTSVTYTHEGNKQEIGRAHV